MHGLRTLIFDVTDLDAAKRFYSAALGKAPYFDQPFYVGFDADGYELGLRPAEGASAATTYLSVDDIHAELARWCSLGASVVEPVQDVGEGILVTTLKDPMGNRVGLIRNLHFAPKLVEARADDLSERTIVHRALVAMPRAEVWTSWATAEGITRWLVDRAKIELRPGGAYELYFMKDAPLGLQGSEGCRILSFIDGRMLSFTWNAPPHLARTRWLNTWVVVELTSVDERTEVVVTHTGWPKRALASEPQWAETFEYFDRAWAKVLEELERFTKIGPAPTPRS